MQRVFADWIDVDPQFARDFQTEGFDARIWELYLRATLVDVGFEVDCVKARPDFRCRDRGSSASSRC